MTDISDQENTEEYRKFIKQSVESGSFFADSFNWYMLRYVSPLCDRTWLFFITVVSVIISYVLVIVIIHSLPIVEKIPIIIKGKDDPATYPKISSLKDSEDLRTIEEAVGKKLLTNYVEERENYDFSTMTVNDLNDKLRKIKNNSTPEEYERFTAFVGSENPNSPIQDFGSDTIRKVTVRYVTFKRDLNKDFVSKAKTLVYQQVPTQADIGYQLKTTIDGKEDVKNYVARINFKLSTIENNNLKKDITFKVSNYELFIDNK